MTLNTRHWHFGTDDTALSDEEIARLAQEIADWKTDLLIGLGDVRHFEGIRDPQDPSDGLVARLQAELSRRAPQTRLVGCSTAGEILGRRVYSGTLLLTGLRLGAAQALVHSEPIPTMEASATAGQALGEGLRRASLAQGLTLRHLWVLAPGVNINGSALVDGLRQGWDEATRPGISGGLAGDGGAFRRTWTVGPRGVRTHEAVAVGLCGPSLVSGSSAAGGWQAFGPVRRVTRVEGNRLDEMDHEPALTIYRRYLGEYAKDLPASGLLFPLQITSGPDQGLIRTILGVDEDRGGLILAGDVSPDAQVRLMHASTDHLVQAADQAAQQLGEGGAAGGQGLALLVSCVGRRIVMGDQTDEEVEVVGDRLPTSTPVIGFYSNGEIAAWHFSGDCRLHNQTMTITWLSDGALSAQPEPDHA